MLLDLPIPPMLMLAVILAVIFVLGWPLEWVPIVLIVVPILLPLVTKLGIDLVWFCTLVAVCLQTAWLSPPVALSAYFLKGVVPDLEAARRALHNEGAELLISRLTEKIDLDFETARRFFTIIAVLMMKEQHI